ncbi:putative zinc-binding protein [Paradesulfitobacterium ferrireducens]|uniref:putative zinc-binding protein n=1 Tax=Paradesulfitobacterium ferrireducens TaxID=2816476 RepID=UPI001A8E9CCF|nr:putative zinc-binding protein [Paradesulfitobacterium ferrireducens]
MEKNRTKVAVTPCAGIGQIFGPITRETGYRLVEEMFPDKTVLVCPPALAVNIQEDLDFIHDYPILILNGCKDRCASKMVQDKGEHVDAEVYLPDILKEHKLSLHGEKRSKLGPKSELAINEMTQVAGKKIVQLLQGN